VDLNIRLRKTINGRKFNTEEPQMGVPLCSANSEVNRTEYAVMLRGSSEMYYVCRLLCVSYSELVEIMKFYYLTLCHFCS
jgi:hypothetical protein